MRILFIGDIVGRPGREILRKGLKRLVDHFGVEFVIANVENSAAGFGVTKDIGDAIAELGVDVMTSGNHIWDKKSTSRRSRACCVLPITRPACRAAGRTSRRAVTAGRLA
jgi:calcineurin-like phosphoesterase